MAATILVVEDDQQFSFLLGEQLRDQYDLLFATDGLEAIRVVQEQQPDLVLLDIMMPGMDGWEACRRIRQFSNVPIIIVSCRTSEIDRVRGLELGADDYIVKPISLLEFRARVAAALRRGKGPITTPHFVQVDERLTVDHGRQEAYVDGEPAGLSAIEYKLLTCLLDNAGYTCTHSSLLSQIWGWEYMDEADYLRVYIHHLRSKIEPNPQKPRYILTERGKGYRFERPSS
ncbi:MAG: response regulator transcription factor [Anaerolineae bacterium]